MMMDWPIKNFQIIILIFTFHGHLAFGESPRSASTTARWIKDKNPELVINVSDLISPAQREIVHSGFSTFTLFAVSPQKITDSDALPELRNICSVKYNTWEEQYQLIKIEPAPSTSTVAKEYKTWSESCLSYTISTPDIIRQLTSGGTMYAILQVRQSSPDEALKIKNWLVKQQSGFMQGLYAHMLGDFQFRGTVSITINVPALPLSEGSNNKLPENKGL
jgi:hypothetical protein